MNPKVFFGELSRRNVYKVGIAYGVVAWLLMQVGSQIFPFCNIPNWVVRGKARFEELQKEFLEKAPRQP